MSSAEVVAQISRIVALCLTGEGCRARVLGYLVRGCVEHIPHLNALAERFKNRPVQFVSITDEEKLVVIRFLQKHPILGWVALDSGESTFRRYGVEGRPQTFLIDAKGVLQAITTPEGVTESVLGDLLAGKALNFPQPLGSPLIGTEPSGPTPVIQVLIRPAAPVAVTGMSPGAERVLGGRFEAWGLTLRDLLSRSYKVQPERVEGPEWSRETKYDLSVATPKGSNPLDWALVREVTTSAFQLKLRHDIRETDVYVLRTLPRQEPKLRPTETRGHSGPWSREKGELDALGVSVGYLARIAEAVLNRPVLDETKLKDRYDLELKWSSKDPKSIATAIREQLGLELAPAVRGLEYLVVQSAEEPKTW